MYRPHYCNLAVQRDGRVRYILSCFHENPVSRLLPVIPGKEVEQLQLSNSERLHGKCLWEPADKAVLQAEDYPLGHSPVFGYFARAKYRYGRFSRLYWRHRHSDSHLVLVRMLRSWSGNSLSGRRV